MDRRTFLASSATIGLAATAQAQPEKRYQGNTSPWPISLNTSTIRPASLEQKIDAAANAGFDAIEPWIDDIENHEKSGGNLKDLAAIPSPDRANFDLAEGARIYRELLRIGREDYGITVAEFVVFLNDSVGFGYSTLVRRRNYYAIKTAIV